MNPIVLSLADGTTFFVGLALVVVGEALLLRFRNPIARPVFTISSLAGLILVVISATPLPFWAYLTWLVPAVAGLAFLSRDASPKRSHVVFCGLLTVSTVGLCVAEIPWHRRPKLTVDEGTTVYVLGDSISAGMRRAERSWPAVLDEMTSLHVVNLAQPGATVESAIDQAKGIAKPGSLVIVEIGGNDLLGNTDASVFRHALDTLVSSLCSKHHQVLLCELPLFPFKNAFGKAQREVGARHGIAMLPKRYFADVLGTEKGTLDGLHLSQEGHNAMARTIAGSIEQE